MKTTIVPAQITTVEDKIAGNLSLAQLLLLVMPVFIGSGIYILVPPTMSAPPFKILLMILLFVAFSLLAIRVKGRILFLWMIIILRYNRRPRFHVFNKNDAYLRSSNSSIKQAVDKEEASVPETIIPQLANVSIAEAVRIEGLIAQPSSKLHFKIDKRGALNVHITEVK